MAELNVAPLVARLRDIFFIDDEELEGLEEENSDLEVDSGVGLANLLHRGVLAGYLGPPSAVRRNDDFFPLFDFVLFVGIQVAFIFDAHSGRTHRRGPQPTRRAEPPDPILVRDVLPDHPGLLGPLWLCGALLNPLAFGHRHRHTSGGVGRYYLPADPAVSPPGLGFPLVLVHPCVRPVRPRPTRQPLPTHAPPPLAPHTRPRARLTRLHHLPQPEISFNLG